MYDVIYIDAQGMETPLARDLADRDRRLRARAAGSR